MVESDRHIVDWGTAQHNEIQHWIETFRLAVAANSSGTPDELSNAMSAAGVFAGTIFGTLIIAGLADDKDKRRVTESMSRNFRAGIEVGKRHAMRLATEESGGTA